MSATNTPPSVALGSYAASVIYSPILFHRAMQQKTFRKRISGPVPKSQYMTDGKKESSHGYPIVQSFNLQKAAGDRETMDIVDRITGKPTMGDRIASDQGSPLEFSRDEIQINLARKVIDTGGRMAQQRTPHDLRAVGMNEAVRYMSDLEDNLAHIHMAGARGSATGAAWKVPLTSDPDFTTICVNPVTPPTRNRYTVPGSATDPSDIGSTDVISLDFFDRLRTQIDTSEVPLQGCVMEEYGVNGSDESPLYIAFISSEQWNTLMTEAGGPNSTGYRAFLAQANERMDFKKHPLFRDVECGIWRNIIICKAPRAIQFDQNDSVSQYNATTGALETVTAAERIHRGIVLGAQALGVAYGDSTPIAGSGQGRRGSGRSELGGPYSWVEEVKDGGNLLQLYAGVMAGYKKLKFTLNNEVYDNGVWVFDTYQAAL